VTFLFLLVWALLFVVLAFYSALAEVGGLSALAAIGSLIL